MYLVIVRVNNGEYPPEIVEKGCIGKYALFNVQAEAEAHAVKYGGYVVEEPTRPYAMDHLIADTVAKTVVCDMDEVKRLADYDKSTQYQRDRQPEYPPATDYLDGIVKGDQAQIDKYIADCLAVKQRHPK